MEDPEIHPSDATPSSSPSSENVQQPSLVQTDQNFPSVIFPPMHYPTLSGFSPIQNEGQTNRGGGIYAICALPFTSPVTGDPPPVTLVPLTYNIPTRPVPAERRNNEGQRQEVPQQHEPQRQIVVRRFQFGFQLDLMLIIKLAIAIFVFTDGSKERLVFLMLFASIAYLYQTGALAPVMRWVSDWARGAIAPPQRAAIREGDGQGLPADENAIADNENRMNVDGANDGHWWGILKEIQMLVVGFVTSLLPGFHNVD